MHDALVHIYNSLCAEMMLIAGCLSQDEVPLSLGSSMPFLEPQDRARAHYLRHNRSIVAMPCEAAVRVEAG